MACIVLPSTLGYRGARIAWVLTPRQYCSCKVLSGESIELIFNFHYCEVNGEGEVLSLFQRRRQRSAHRDAEADRLIDLMGLQAYAAAARLAREANDFWTMRYWLRVQEAIARKTDLRFSVSYLLQTTIYMRPRDDSFDFGMEIAQHTTPALVANGASDRTSDVEAAAERAGWAFPANRRPRSASAGLRPH